jgi:hypothetical protein
MRGTMEKNATRNVPLSSFRAAHACQDLTLKKEKEKKKKITVRCAP